jgi:hypothetical protein
MKISWNAAVLCMLRQYFFQPTLMERKLKIIKNQIFHNKLILLSIQFVMLFFKWLAELEKTFYLSLSNPHDKNMKIETFLLMENNHEKKQSNKFSWVSRGVSFFSLCDENTQW